MLTRRIVASACALCLAIPTLATAKDTRFVGHVHRAAPVLATGDTKYDLQLASQAPGVSGDTKSDLPGASAPAPATHNVRVPGVDRVGSLTAAQLATAYGKTKPAATPVSVAAPDHATDGWRLAAAAEAAVLAAFAIGAAVFMTGRQRRAPRLGM